MSNQPHLETPREPYQRGTVWYVDVLAENVGIRFAQVSATSEKKTREGARLIVQAVNAFSRLRNLTADVAQIPCKAVTTGDPEECEGRKCFGCRARAVLADCEGAR